jgi:hypothetical protein
VRSKEEKANFVEPTACEAISRNAATEILEKNQQEISFRLGGKRQMGGKK